jgi:hypothetical protein
MPLTLSIDQARRRIRVTATERVCRADIARNLSERVASDVVAFDQIWDVREATWDISLGDLQSIAQDYRAALAGEPPGLLVMVASSDEQFGTLRQQEAYLRYHGREVTVCRSMEEAEAWLDRQWQGRR